MVRERWPAALSRTVGRVSSQWLADGFQPELEYQQRPQPLAVVPPASRMFLEKTVHERRRHDAPLEKPRRGEVVPEKCPPGTAEPGRQRHAKPHFGAIEDFGRQPI